MLQLWGTGYPSAGSQLLVGEVKWRVESSNPVDGSYLLILVFEKDNGGRHLDIFVYLRQSR